MKEIKQIAVESLLISEIKTEMSEVILDLLVEDVENESTKKQIVGRLVKLSSRLSQFELDIQKDAINLFFPQKNTPTLQIEA